MTTTDQPKLPRPADLGEQPIINNMQNRCISTTTAINPPCATPYAT